MITNTELKHLMYYGGDTRILDSNNNITNDYYKEGLYSYKNAYLTIEALLAKGSFNEEEKVREGKKLIPDFFTSKENIKELININLSLFSIAYKLYLDRHENKEIEVTRACRNSEIINEYYAPISTTTTTIDNLVKLGYTNKNELAILDITLNEDSLYIPFKEIFKDNYLKEEEEEYLVAPFSSYSYTPITFNADIRGKDGKKAYLYDVKVLFPDLNEIDYDKVTKLENYVYNDTNLNKIYNYINDLNNNIYDTKPDIFDTFKDSVILLTNIKCNEIKKQLDNNKVKKR